MKFITRSSRLTIVLLVALAVVPFTVSAASVSFWSQYSWSQELMALLKEFTAETGIEVEFRTIGFGTDELFVALAGGSPPDLFTHGAAALGAFGALNQLRPLESVLAEWDFIDDILPNVLEAGVYDGVQVAVPWIGVEVRDLIYRVDHFEESGLEGAPTHWDDLVDYGRKLVRTDQDGNMTRSAIHLLNYSPAGQMAFSMFFNQLGGSLIVDGKSGLDDPRAETALSFFVDLFHEHRIASNSHDVIAGTTAMAWTGNIFERARNVGVLEYLDVATFPYAEQPATFMAVNWAAVPTGAKNPDGAYKLLEFLLRPENQSRLNRSEGYLPFYTEAIRWDWVADQPLIVKLMRASQYGVPNPPHQRWFEMRDILVSMVEKAHRREQPPAFVVEEAHRLISNLLGE